MGFLGAPQWGRAPLARGLLYLPHVCPCQVRERLRAALERVGTLEEELAGAHRQVSHVWSLYATCSLRLVGTSWTVGSQEKLEYHGACLSFRLTDHPVPFRCLPCSRGQAFGMECQKRRGPWSWARNACGRWVTQNCRVGHSSPPFCTLFIAPTLHFCFYTLPSSRPLCLSPGRIRCHFLVWQFQIRPLLP